MLSGRRVHRNGDQRLLLNEIRRQLGRDSVLLTERTDLGVDLRVRTVLATLGAEISDAPSGPESRNEIVATAVVGEIDILRPAHATARSAALEAQGGVTASRVARKDHRVATREDVDWSLRLDAVEPNAVRLHAYVRRDGIGDAARDE